MTNDMTWWVDSHPVTGDPYMRGFVQHGLAEWGGTITAHIEGGDLVVRGYDSGTSKDDDPDYEARSGTLDEAVRFVLGSALLKAAPEGSR
jgi:hypothetical protein